MERVGNLQRGIDTFGYEISLGRYINLKWNIRDNEGNLIGISVKEVGYMKDKNENRVSSRMSMSWASYNFIAITNGSNIYKIGVFE